MKILSVIRAAMFSVVAGFALTSVAHADTFVLNSSNGGDGYVNAIAGGFDLFGADNSPGTTDTTYLATAGGAETLTFNWAFTTNDCCGSGWDPGGYVVNGVFTQLSTDSFGTAGDISSSGALTLTLAAGDSYGFYIHSPDSCCGRSDIAVTGGAVPEPATWALMFAGVAFVGGALRSRRRTAMATAA